LDKFSDKLKNAIGPNKQNTCHGKNVAMAGEHISVMYSWLSIHKEFDYFSWNGWVYDRQGNQVILEKDLK
jgi:hypothetical protein